jgi:hypothetical protein
MTRTLFTTCILSLAFAGVANAQAPASSPDSGSHYSLAQVKELARSAHAPEQYKALATYYGKQQKDYLQMAAEEKKEWDRMGHHPVNTAAKYPRPGDSARNLYEYYMGKASESATLEARYNRLASPDTLVNAQ